MSQIDISKVIDFHFVIPGNPGDLFDVHTHGLEGYGHPEFQVLIPGFAGRAAHVLLHNHADSVINHGETFEAGEVVDIDGVACGYEEVPGDYPDDPMRLRIVDMPGECRCGSCGTQRRGDEDELNSEGLTTS